MSYKVVQTPTAQLYDLPLIGDDLANIGRVIDMWADPCKPYAEIWVYGFFQAFPTLFISLVKPELIDVNIHKGSHRPRKGKRAKFRASAIFRDALIEVPVPDWRVFRIYEFGQRIGWYFLVADATENFAINWISTAYMWTGCPGGLSPYAIFTNNHTPVGVNITPNAMLIQNPLSHRMDIQPFYAQIIDPGFYRATFNMVFSPWGAPVENSMPEMTWLAFWPNGGSPQPLAPLETYTAGGSKKGASGSSAIQGCEAGDRFLIYNQGSKDGHCWADGTFEVSNINNDPIAPDP